MPADITIPWIDPLKLVDAYARIVLKPDQAAFMLYAPVLTPDGLMGNVLLKGARRADWISAFSPSAQDNTHVVTFVPMLTHANGVPTLRWQPLYMAELRAWADQLAVLHLDPLGENREAMATAHRSFIGPNGPTVPTREDRRAYPNCYPTMAFIRAHTAQFLRLLNALRHPTSAVIPEGITPEGIATLVRPDLTNDDYFYPLCTCNSSGNVLRVAHSRNYGAPGRSGWRRVQHHGLRPDALFYGKQWIAELSAPDVLHAGVEMEMELQNSSQRQRMLVSLFSSADEMGLTRGQERLHVEQDGSIAGHGVEVVLMPHEIHSYHAETFWRKMWQTAVSCGASNAQRTCGMHVHVSALPALSMPRSTDPLWPGRHKATEQNYSDTTGLLIDVVTAMLIGGPQLSAFALEEVRPDSNDVTTQFMPPGTLGPRCTALNGEEGNTSRRYGNTTAENATEERFVTQAFGRPARWSGDYAGTQLHLMRKRPGTPIDRYRHVNWNNHHTIEFRTFGPHDYNEHVEDWVNVATQMCSAIVHFCRANALHILRKGCRAADAGLGVEQMLRTLPRWLRPMLLLADNTYRENRDTALILAMGVPLVGRERYALTTPGAGGSPFGSAHPQPWLIGLPHVEQRHAWGSYLYDRTWAAPQPGSTALRASVMHGSILLLWRRFREFLDRQAPQYAILQAHLQQRVYPKLPNEEQQALMLHRREVRPPQAERVFNRTAVDAAINALGLDDTRTSSTSSSWTVSATETANDVFWADVRENLRAQRPSTST